ncbi:MAG: GDP-mannose 4,6-dehydratase [Siphonobacter sp.]
MKHYLITGGAGFIGSHLSEQLLASSDTLITCIDNFDTFYEDRQKRANLREVLDNPRFRLIEEDVTNRAHLLELLDGQTYDAIIHLAAKAGVRNSIEQPEHYYQVNVMGTLSMLEIARALNIKKFIFASSSSVYGENPNVPWQEIETDLQPISPYASSKISGELLGRTYAHLHGIQFLALRFFTVYGSRQRPDLAIHTFARLIYQGKPISLYGDGSTRRDYTHVSDIVTGIQQAIEYEGEGFSVFNLASGKPITLLQLVNAIEKAVGKEAIFVHQPHQPGDVFQTYGDLKRSTALLGYRPKVTLAEGLQEFINWRRKMLQVTH